jgi:hypothetical protein
VIPQKGTFLETGNRVLIGIAKRNEDQFLNRTATIYYTGAKFPTTIALDGLHFFAPYIKGKGIRDIYQIMRIRTITSKEAHQSDEPGDDLRLAFHLKFHHAIADDFVKIDTTKMIFNSFVDTTFEDWSTLTIR